MRSNTLFFRLRLPAQPVDATPSNALIRQCFPGRSDLFGCPRSKPSQGSVPADLTLASDLAFVFNATWVRLECCVDPLRPPALPDKLFVDIRVQERGCRNLKVSFRTSWRLTRPRRATEAAEFGAAQLPEFFAGAAGSCETMLIRNAFRS